MSDASGLIDAALKGVLKVDPGVVAAFGENPVRVLDLPPAASAAVPMPFVTLGGAHVVAELYDGIDAGTYHSEIHVWSRTAQKSWAEVKAIAAAVMAAVTAIEDLELGPDFVFVAAIPVDVRYLEDPDGLTLHAVVCHEIGFDPAV